MQQLTCPTMIIPPHHTRLGNSDYQPFPVLVPLALRQKLYEPLISKAKSRAHIQSLLHILYYTWTCIIHTRINTFTYLMFF